MASVYLDASRDDQRTQDERIAAGDSPAGSSRYDGTSGRIDVRQGIDVGKAESDLRSIYGDLFTQGDLDGVLRNTGRDDNPLSYADAIAARRQDAEARRRSEQEGGPQGDGGGHGGRTLPGGQFDDAYTSMLEGIAKSQMGEVRSNPQLDSLMSFLNKRFTDLSTNPGYSNADLSLLNTQAFEPIEQLRNQTQRRELERTARAGYLPTSGLTRENQRTIDTDYDRMRTVANRDLSINAINRRESDLNKALDIGQLQSLTIPAAQRGEELALSNLLYQLPRTAMFDALSVVNGTPNSNDAFNQALQLATQNRYQDAQNAQQNSAIWGQIGQVLQDLFRS